MLRQELQELQTGRGALRRFGLLVGGVFTLIGIWFFVRGRSFYPYFFWPGVGLMLAGLLIPGALRRIYIGWMAMALVLGLIVTTVLLTLFFLLVVTPIGWVARLSGKDFLQRRLDPARASYWIERSSAEPEKITDYERQF